MFGWVDDGVEVVDGEEYLFIQKVGLDLAVGGAGRIELGRISAFSNLNYNCL